MRIGRYSRAGLALVFVPLYGGPILAGLSGHPATTLAFFAAFFLIYTAMTRKLNLQVASGWVTLVALAVVQIVIVSVAFGLGVGAATLFGAVTLPLWLPLILSATAAAYGARLYSDSAEMDVFLTSAIKELDSINRQLSRDLPDIMPMPSEAAQRAVDKALEDLRALPQDARIGVIDPIVQRLEDAVGLAAFDPLYDAAGEVDGTEDARVDLALLRFVASPRMRRMLVERGEGGLAPMLLVNAERRAVREEARSMLWTLIEEGAPRCQLPDPDWLAELDALFPGEGYDALAAHRALASS